MGPSLGGRAIALMPTVNPPLHKADIKQCKKQNEPQVTFVIAALNVIKYTVGSNTTHSEQLQLVCG